MEASPTHLASSPVWGDGNPNCCSSSPNSSRRRASVDRRDWLRELVRPVAAGWAQVSNPVGFPLSLATAGYLLSPEQSIPEGQEGDPTQSTSHGTNSLLVTMGPSVRTPPLLPLSLRDCRQVVTCRTTP